MHGSGHDIDISSGAASKTMATSAPIKSQASSSLRRKATTCSLDTFVTITLHVTFILYTFVIWLGEPLLLPTNEKDWCWSAQNDYPIVKIYDNPDYNNNPCYKERPPHLLFLSQMEISFARRMFTSVILGAAIGFERKASDRPAGIRTMSLVCLGSSFFTYCGQLAFRSSTMGSDAARVAAAIPSGVGFLGAGLIWKGTVGQKGTPDERHEIHGLTTAASVWLSAAVGVGVGGRLYVVSFYAVALVILVLRLGPRLYFQDDASSYASDGEYYDGMSTDDEESFDGSDEMRIILSGTEAWDRHHGMAYGNEERDGANRIEGTITGQYPIRKSRYCPNLRGEKLLKNDEQRQEKQQRRKKVAMPSSTSVLQLKSKLKRRSTAGVSFHS